MGDTHHRSRNTSSTLTLRNAGAGQIVEVQGGHIVRSTGRKDRHSKVCTAKGPRDRRVRLSAHTAIQFYDVQDRLGYDRPSKAVDWLINKAKAAIDGLAELPAWKPSSTIPSGKNPVEDVFKAQPSGAAAEAEASGAMVEEDGSGGIYMGQDQQQRRPQICNNVDNSCLLPTSLDSDATADLIKSSFPEGASARGEVSVATTSSPPTLSGAIQLHNYPPYLRSRTSSNSQDMRLSLLAFQDQMSMHSHYHQPQQLSHHSTEQQSLFPAAAATRIGCHNPYAGWAESQQPEMGLFQRLISWNTATDCGGGGGFMFNSPPSAPPLPPPSFSHGHTQFFSQRGPLQSSNTPLIRAWIGDPSITSNIDHHQTSSTHPQSISGIGFALGGFSGFYNPAEIQGEEVHGGNLNKLSSAPSGSCH
ncbi:hypothetical protein Nepgr_027405 [Nepenthes gracilis]|uniref:TCP domain-containing protein n=1 Tax=Nepenthes gracilis TaxID=150966 RepID=A0AAD3TBP4_NEPGR|nr:hypothetical protein Nepgr_027405 [Nepenthes gracilis]